MALLFLLLFYISFISYATTSSPQKIFFDIYLKYFQITAGLQFFSTDFYVQIFKSCHITNTFKKEKIKMKKIKIYFLLILVIYFIINRIPSLDSISVLYDILLYIFPEFHYKILNEIILPISERLHR